MRSSAPPASMDSLLPAMLAGATLDQKQRLLDLLVEIEETSQLLQTVETQPLPLAVKPEKDSL